MGSIGLMRVGPPEGVRAPVSNATVWGWFFFVSSVFWPRLLLIAFWIFDTDLLKRAFGPWIVPVLGFFIAPWTTLAYSVMWGVSSDRVNGAEWLVVAVGVTLDLGTWSLGHHLARSR
jgi:hypothetical protein